MTDCVPINYGASSSLRSAAAVDGLRMEAPSREGNVGEEDGMLIISLVCSHT